MSGSGLADGADEPLEGVFAALACGLTARARAADAVMTGLPPAAD